MAFPGRPEHPDVLDGLASSSHFADADLYDRIYAGRDEDVLFYAGLAEGEASVLEIGCGDGRIALPIARSGVRVVGVDRSSPMLAAFRRRLAAEPDDVRARVAVRRADMRSFRVRERFPLVLCTFNTFLHLYTRDDVERFLRRVRAHLAPGGKLVFDASVPYPADLADERPRRGRAVVKDGVRCRYTETFVYEQLEQILYVTMAYTPVDGSPPSEVVLAQRQWFPAELEALLHYNGFLVESCVDAFGGEPADGLSDHLLWTCSPRRGR